MVDKAMWLSPCLRLRFKFFRMVLPWMLTVKSLTRECPFLISVECVFIEDKLSEGFLRKSFALSLSGSYGDGDDDNYDDGYYDKRVLAGYVVEERDQRVNKCLEW